jgi:hypothetical protein
MVQDRCSTLLTGFSTALITILPIMFQYCYKCCYGDNRNLWTVMKAGGLAPQNLIQPTISLEMPVRAIMVFPVFRLLTDFVCLLTYEFCLSLWKIARCSVIFLLPLFATGRWFSQGNLVSSSSQHSTLWKSIVNYRHWQTILGQNRYNSGQRSTFMKIHRLLSSLTKIIT